jgi:hypothetical protein
MSELSTFLYAEPSFSEGIARILDFGDTLTEYNRSENGEMADYLALSADWRSIGSDIQRAILQFQELRLKEKTLVQGQTEKTVAAR